jgi:hypothetical protein
VYIIYLRIYIFTGGKSEQEIVDDLETKLSIYEDEKSELLRIYIHMCMHRCTFMYNLINIHRR